MKLGIFTAVFEKCSNIRFHKKSVSFGAELFHAYGRTYMRKLKVNFFAISRTRLKIICPSSSLDVIVFGFRLRVSN